MNDKKHGGGEDRPKKIPPSYESGITTTAVVDY